MFSWLQYITIKLRYAYNRSDHAAVKSASVAAIILIFWLYFNLKDKWLAKWGTIREKNRDNDSCIYVCSTKKYCHWNQENYLK